MKKNLTISRKWIVTINNIVYCLIKQVFIENYFGNRIFVFWIIALDQKIKSPNYICQK